MARAWLWAAILGLAACASPAPRHWAEPAAAAPSVSTVAESAAEPVSELPALNLRCQTDADCAVKNIGNCCGYLPACLNKASPTAPDLVLARCAASGEEPICDHPMIYACLCEQGICKADPSVGPGG